MPSASSLSPDGRFMALFVGPKHSGKTVAACSCVKKDPPNRVNVEDFDGRIRGILGVPWLDRNKIDYEFYPPKTKAGETVFQKLNTRMEALLVACNVGQCPYGTEIIDSLTSETFALLQDSIPLTHASGGKKIGSLSMAGPEDYGFEATGTYQMMAFLRSVPIQNIIVTAHVVDKFGKLDPSDRYSESVVVGEKLSIRDKIGANVGIYFDHIFRFDRRMVGGKERFFVRFRGDLACTSFPELDADEHDITGKNFYEYMMGLINKGT